MLKMFLKLGKISRSFLIFVCPLGEKVRMSLVFMIKAYLSQDCRRIRIYRIYPLPLSGIQSMQSCGLFCLSSQKNKTYHVAQNVCDLQELIFAHEDRLVFFLWELIFAIFRKYPVPSTDYVFVFVKYLQWK